VLISRLGLFLPVLLEQLPRERGVLFSDRTKPCISPPGSTDSGDQASLRVRDAGSEDQCIVTFLGAEVTTASFAMYTTSAAVLTQAVTLICFSSFADYGTYVKTRTNEWIANDWWIIGPYRKNMLLAFAYTGAFVSLLFIFVTPSVYYLAPVLVIIGVTCK
jgi:UMF1 family MFS transporter